MSDDPEARLHDAIMSAAARDRTAHETGRRRDSLRFITAIWRATWRLRRAERKEGERER